MTEQEFAHGWKLLTSQPWGKSYRESPLAQTQASLYWKRLKHVDAEVWAAVSEWAATGDRWPSLGELLQSIQLSMKDDPESILDRNATIQWEDAPWPLQIVFNYAAQHHITIKEAALTTIPQWMKENPHHEDYADANAFLDKTKNNFGIKARKRGNIRCIP